jgi:ATP-dependent DNA ligase
MTSRVEPPLAPMLARLARVLPEDGYRYEPKWDGFRCVAFRAGDDVDLRSRNDRPLARYFPEIVAGLRLLSEAYVVLDGELVVARDASLDFAALMGRLHPAASKVATLSAANPATFVVFDALARGDRDLQPASFGERRGELEDLLDEQVPRVLITPITDDPGTAQRWLDEFRGGGVDGVVAKHVEAPYQPGKRAMIKVKHEETADCVVAGFRWYADLPIVGSLPLVEHPWAYGFALEGGRQGRLRGAASRWSPEMGLDWVPLRPELVCEVAYDQLDGRRLRNPGRFRRWRPDRDARSCLVDQLDAAASANPLALLAAAP